MYVSLFEERGRRKRHVKEVEILIRVSQLLERGCAGSYFMYAASQRAWMCPELCRGCGCWHCESIRTAVLAAPLIYTFDSTVVGAAGTEQIRITPPNSTGHSRESDSEAHEVSFKREQVCRHDEGEIIFSFMPAGWWSETL